MTGRGVVRPGSFAIRVLGERKSLANFAVIVSLWAVSKVVAHVFAEHIQEIRIGLLRGHSVITGDVTLVRPLIRDHRVNHRPIVLADPDPSSVFPSSFDRKRPLTVKGDPALRETLFESGIKSASCLFLLSNDDQKNIDVAVSAWELVRKRRVGALSCYVHIGDRRLTEILENREADWLAGLFGELPSRFQSVVSLVASCAPLSPLGAESAVHASD